MDISKFGPLANMVAIAACLVAVFSALLLKTVGRVAKWSWLVENTPKHVVSAPAQIVGIALIAVTYLTIDESNLLYFAGGAFIFALAGAVLILKFDQNRRSYTHNIPVVANGGVQPTDQRGQKQSYSVIIGQESKMKSAAKKAYRAQSGISVTKFMSGYGHNEVNNPESIWSREHLADIGHRMMLLLALFMLCSVVSLDMAASAIEMQLRANSTAAVSDPPEP